MIKYFDWTDEIVENELDEVCSILKNDGIVIFPTETVYGMGGSALSKDAIDKIYKNKQRPRGKPLSLMVDSIEKIEKYAVISNDMERKIIERCMPGPITIILKKKQNFGDYFATGTDTIGIRIPANPIALSILEKVGQPLVVPSANISGHESGIDISKILLEFGDTVDAVIDGGVPAISLDSTIIEVVDGEIKIIRQGRVTKDDILDQITDKVVEEENEDEAEENVQAIDDDKIVLNVSDYRFQRIKSGYEKFEFRLFDDLTRRIRMNEVIVLFNEANQSTIKVRVKGLMRYNTFEDMFRDIIFDADRKLTIQEKVFQMRSLYPDNIVATHGVIGIRFDIVL